MTWKADTTTSANSIAVQGVTTVDGSSVSGDFQGTTLVTVSGTAATSVGAANPLPVTQTHGKTILYAAINTAASGDTTVATPTGTNRIKVLGVLLVCNAPVVVTFKSATTAVTGPMSFAANGGFQDRAADPNIPLFRTSASAALVLNLSGAVQVSGYLTYLDEA